MGSVVQDMLKAYSHQQRLQFPLKLETSQDSQITVGAAEQPNSI